MTQVQFANAFGLPWATVRDWEQDRSVPDSAARAYLQVIAHDPNAVKAALAAADNAGAKRIKAGLAQGSVTAPGSSAITTKDNIRLARANPPSAQTNTANRPIMTPEQLLRRLDEIEAKYARPVT